MNIPLSKSLLAFLLNWILALTLFYGCHSKEVNPLPEKIRSIPIPDLPLISRLAREAPFPKYQPAHIVCETNPVLSFTIGIPFSWVSVPMDISFLPEPMKLNQVARFRKHQKNRVVPFTEIYVLPIQNDIFPEDWLLWYLEKQHWTLLRHARETVSGLNIDTLLFQTSAGQGIVLLGRISAFQWGSNLWIVASTCLESQYVEEATAFAVFAGTLLPTEIFRSSRLEWNSLSLPESAQILLYPNSYKATLQKHFVEFLHKDRKESRIRFWFSNPPVMETLSPTNFSKKTTKLLNPSGKPIKLEQFLEPSLEHLILEWEIQQNRLVLEMQGPNRDTEPLLWMENKYVLEKLCQPLFSEKKENP